MRVSVWLPQARETVAPTMTRCWGSMTVPDTVSDCAETPIANTITIIPSSCRNPIFGIISRKQTRFRFNARRHRSSHRDLLHTPRIYTNCCMSSRGGTARSGTCIIWVFRGRPATAAAVHHTSRRYSGNSTNCQSANQQNRASVAVTCSRSGRGRAGDLGRNGRGEPGGLEEEEVWFRQFDCSSDTLSWMLSTCRATCSQCLPPVAPA